MSITPNIEGFVDAQARLRENLGMDVRIYTPIDPVYASGTVLNPDTLMPYDPVLKPLASGFASGIVRASLIYKRLSTEDDTDTNAAGIFSDKSAVLSLAVEDWPMASAATQFEVLGQRYEIRDAQPDGLGNRETRRLIFGEVM